MALNELANLVDQVESVQVALVLRLAPCKQSVPAQHDAIAAGIFLNGALHHHRQFKPWALPRQPHKGVAELAVELLHLRFAVGGGSQCDTPVRVQMVYVRKWKKPVQRCVDRSSHRISAVRAKRVQFRHLVFAVCALVAPLQYQQLFLVERCKAGALDAAQIAARAFDPEHFDPFACQGVDFGDL